MLKRMNLTGSPNLGVYISVNDEVAIVPFNLSTEVEDIIKETLEVDTIKTSIAGCNLNGAWLLEIPMVLWFLHILMRRSFKPWRMQGLMSV